MAVKVLIVEDNPVARSFLTRVVKESFSDALLITEAGDLETARRQIGPLRDGAQTADPFKLILVDLELPDGSGLELLDELRQYPATKIVTTLYSDDEHLFPALQAGADGYLLKEDRFGASTFTSALAFAAPVPVEIEPPLDLPALTPREVEVLTFLSKGFTIKEIAALMSIKWFTVNDHIKSIYRKLNVSSRAEAAVLASKQGLV